MAAFSTAQNWFNRTVAETMSVDFKECWYENQLWFENDHKEKYIFYVFIIAYRIRIEKNTFKPPFLLFKKVSLR